MGLVLAWNRNFPCEAPNEILRHSYRYAAGARRASAALRSFHRTPAAPARDRTVPQALSSGAAHRAPAQADQLAAPPAACARRQPLPFGAGCDRDRTSVV